MVSHLIISFHEGALLSIIQGDLDMDMSNIHKLIFYSARYSQSVVYKE